MKHTVMLLIAVTLLLPPFACIAQEKIPDTAKNLAAAPLRPANTIPEPDDEFNLFLLTFAIAFCSAIIGATIVGAFAAAIVFLFLFAMASAGILSTSILIGIYRRSIAAGFRAFLIILCGIGGILIGTPGFWLVNRIFDLPLTNLTSAVIGAAGGLIGGIILGIIIFKPIRLLSTFLYQKFIGQS